MLSESRKAFFVRNIPQFDGGVRATRNQSCLITEEHAVIHPVRVRIKSAFALGVRVAGAPASRCRIPAGTEQELCIGLRLK